LYHKRAQRHPQLWQEKEESQRVLVHARDQPEIDEDCLENAKENEARPADEADESARAV